jgi:hypothetical protein
MVNKLPNGNNPLIDSLGASSLLLLLPAALARSQSSQYLSLSLSKQSKATQFNRQDKLERS